jgi:hypothetical protein
MPSPAPIVRELPTKVAETFYVVQDPALFNTSYSDALLVRPLLRVGFGHSVLTSSRGAGQGQTAPPLLHYST